MDEGQESTKRKLAVMESTLALQLEWVRGVDTKMQFLLTVEIALLGALAAVVPESANFCWRTHAPWVVAGAAGLLVSLALCAIATVPRTKAPARSLLFFGEIAMLTADAFDEAVKQRDDSDRLSDLVIQTHKNATLAARKYAILGAAYWAFFIGLLGWFPAVYFLYRG